MKVLSYFFIFIIFLSSSSFAQDLNQEIDKMVESIQKLRNEVFQDFDVDQLGRGFGASLNSGINIQQKKIKKNGKDYLEIHITPKNKESKLDVTVEDSSYKIVGTIKKESTSQKGSFESSSSYSSIKSLPSNIIGRPYLRKDGAITIISMQIDPNKEVFRKDQNFENIFKQVRDQFGPFFQEQQNTTPKEENESNGIYRLKKLKERQI